MFFEELKRDFTMRLALDETPAHAAPNCVEEVGCGVGTFLPTPLGNDLVGGGNEISEEARRILSSAPTPIKSPGYGDETRQHCLEHGSSEQWMLRAGPKEGGSKMSSLILREAAPGLQEFNDIEEILCSSLTQEGVARFQNFGRITSRSAPSDVAPFVAQVIELVVCVGRSHVVTLLEVAPPITPTSGGEGSQGGYGDRLEA